MYDSSTITAGFDAADRLTSLTDSTNGNQSFAWDGLDHLTRATSPQGTVRYSTDAAGRRQWMLPASQAQVNYTFDNANRLTNIGQSAETVQIGYDNANRRQTLTLPNGVIVTYGFDDANELTGLTYQKGDGTTLGDLVYTYDGAGHRNGQTGSLASDVLPTATTANGVFDLNNRQTKYDGTTQTYDLDGNLTNDGTYAYDWNARNQLYRIRQGTTVLASYTYDALGRRKSKNFNGGTATTFLYDGPNPIQETQGSTVTPILAGLGVDEYFARTEATGRTYFLADAIGSTIGLTDTSGNLVQTYQYGPYGEVTAQNAGFTNPYQYTGRENDGDGLYYYRARYYSPGMKRFVGEDPVWFEGGQNNFYAYAGGDPINMTDPNGLTVTMTCRPLSALGKMGINMFMHCGDFVWHYETDPCTGQVHKVITAQFSLPGGATRPTTEPENNTYQDDRSAFSSPNDDDSSYDIAPPDGMTQNQFDNAVTQIGNGYSQGSYNLFGPNSNTAAATIIAGAGGAPPPVFGAVAEYYYLSHGF